MKKLVSLMLAGTLLAGLAGCSGGGESELAGLALLGGSQSVSDDTAPMKYMEFMYNDEQGKKLNDIAMGGIDRLSPDVQQRIVRLQKNAILDGTAQGIQNSSASNWWGKYELKAEDFAQYMSTPNGASLIDSIIDGSSSQQSSIVYGSSRTSPRRSTTATIMDTLEENNSINIAAVTSSLSSMRRGNRRTGIGLRVVIKNTSMNELSAQIAAGFEQTNYNISELATWLKEKDLQDAKNSLSSKIDELASINEIEHDYFLSLVKNYFTNGYEEMFNRAFISAEERTAELNARPSAVPIPGIMLFSDVLFMKQMSDTRIEHSGYIYSGLDLLKFRANVSKNDLVRLKEIKTALYKDFPAAPTQEQIDMVALLVAWEIQLRAHIAVVYGYDIDETDLADPKNVGYATGTFGDYCGIDSNSQWGENLINAAAMSLASLFNDGDELTSVFDMGKSGDLAGGKSIRIVSGGKNVAYDLGLIPLYKKGLTKDSESPDGTHCYIDPAVGRFVLPRPIYWSKMESQASITSPEIRHPEYAASVYTLYGNVIYDGAKFTKGYTHITPAIFTNYVNRIYPLSDSSAVSVPKGVISIWAQALANGLGISACHATINIYINNSAGTYLQIQDRFGADDAHLVLVVNNVVVQDVPVDTFSAINHYYIAFDADKGLSGGKSIRVFMNNAEIMSSDSTISGGNISLETLSNCALGAIAWAKLDNLKIWNHVVSEDPSFEYNGGSGRETALHPVYGESDGYAPKLTGMGNGVGFYSLK